MLVVSKKMITFAKRNEKRTATHVIIYHNMKRQTKAIHTPYHRRDAYDALAVPVYNQVAFEFDNAEQMALAFTNKIDAPDYGRAENPTVINLERRVAALTGAKSVAALNSGMAAISNTLLGVAEAGRNIVTSKHVFGNTYALLVTTLQRLGIETRLVDLTNIKEVEAATDDATCCIYLEILTNPQQEVADLAQLARVAHQHHIPLIADSTAIPFTETHLHQLGVDIEVVSSTKYLSGGGTSLGGLIIDYGTTPGFTERIKLELLFNLGAYMTPQVAYMQTLGLETLNARYRVQAANAMTLARRMQTELANRLTVNYTGLEDNPYHELALRQFGPTAGAMVCIDLPSREDCFRFIDRLKLIHRATNLFDSRTLAIHPASTIFGNFTDEQVAAMDVRQTTIRLSIGLEDPDDLYDDIKQALG